MKGIYKSIEEANILTYKPAALTFEKIKEVLNNIPKSPRQTIIYTSPYGDAIMRGDKKLIAYYERKMRIDKIIYLRLLINRLGIKKARVIAWLNDTKRYGYEDHWTIFGYSNWKYKNIGDGEMDTIILQIKLKDDKFSITLLADDSDGYGGYKYRKVLSENISFNSVINQIKYFTKRLKNGAY